MPCAIRPQTEAGPIAEHIAIISHLAFLGNADIDPAINVINATMLASFEKEAGPTDHPNPKILVAVYKFATKTII